MGGAVHEHRPLTGCIPNLLGVYITRVNDKHTENTEYGPAPTTTITALVEESLGVRPIGPYDHLPSTTKSVRLDGYAALLLDVIAEYVNQPPATLLRRIAEVGLQQFREEMEALGVHIDGKLKEKQDAISQGVPA